MNDPLDYVRELAERAHVEEPPQGDVVPRAVARVRRLHAPPLVQPWRWCAAGALALAAIAAFVFVDAYRQMPDPILQMFQMASINL